MDGCSGRCRALGSSCHSSAQHSLAPTTPALPCAQYERHHVCAQLDVTLTSLNCRAMVVGHTPQMGGCNCECNGRVWRVDVGMSSGVLNAEPEVLEFRRWAGAGLGLGLGWLVEGGLLTAAGQQVGTRSLGVGLRR